MGKKILFVLNAFYPYKQEESFLANEVNYYSGFDQIIMYPMLVYKYNKSDELKYNVIANSKIKYLRGTELKKISSIVKSVVTLFKSVEFYLEILNLLRTKRFSLNNIQKLMLFLVRCNYSVSVVQSHIDKNIDKNDEIILYSYWMNFDAYVASKIKKNNEKLNIVKFVTRCHRVDLYEYAEPTKYIPMRKFIFEHVDKIYSISDDGALYLKNKYDLNTEKVSVERLGTDDYGINISQKGTALKIVSCSWLRTVKRVHLIVESLKNVEVPVEWSHYGTGEEYNRIQKAIQDLNNPLVKCTLMGQMRNDEVLKEYASKDFNVFINVSESEGIPVSIMEAMSFGKIIIATDVGGTREIVIDGENGYLLDKDFQVSELTRRIESIYYMNNKQIMEKSTRSREIWEEKSNAVTNYTKFVNLLLN